MAGIGEVHTIEFLILSLAVKCCVRSDDQVENTQTLHLEHQDTETNTVVGSIGMSINVYLWQGALDTLSFMPLSSADPIGGTIITDWYSSTNNPDERCKLNIFISGKELKTQNLRVASFCQNYQNNRWVNKDINDDSNIKLENAILNKAKKLKLESS